MSDRMHNLTLASAKHLHSQGYITKSHHDQIVAQVSRKKRRAAPAGIPGSALMQQAQAPIPGASGPAATPPGTSSGYSEDEGQGY